MWQIYLLRILANLHEATSGEVIIRASTLNNQPVNSVVFQEYAVFPWRTTVENVAFGLEMRGISKKERQEFVKVILPASLPAIFTGLRLSLGVSLLIIVAAEFVAADRGLASLSGSLGRFCRQVKCTWVWWSSPF